MKKTGILNVVWSLLIVGCASINTKYYRAVTAGNVAETNQALDQGARVDHREEYSPLPLVVAVRSGDVNLINALLKRKPGEFHLNGALAEAMKTEKLEIAKTLITAGANPEFSIGEVCSAKQPISTALLDLAVPVGSKVKPSFADSSLICAIDNGYDELAVRLIDNGAEIGLSSYIRDKVICRALYKNASDRVFAALLKRKAEIKLSENCRQDSYSDRTPLSWAKVQNRKELYAMIKAAGGVEGDKSSRRPTIDDYANVKMQGIDGSLKKAEKSDGSTELHKMCPIEFVTSNSGTKIRRKCTQIRKIRDVYVAWDHDCGNIKEQNQVDSKILAGCALGGKPEHFVKMGLRIPARNEYR